jgi:hypothetical protein
MYIYDHISPNSSQNEKYFREKLYGKLKHILCLITLPENRAIYKKMGGKYGTAVRPETTIWRKRFAYCIPKAAATHRECPILFAFRRQLWLHERATILRYTYISFIRSSASELNYTVRTISGVTLYS